MSNMCVLLNRAWEYGITMHIRPRVDDCIVDIEFEYSAGEDQYLLNRLITLDLADPKTRDKDYVMDYMFNIIESIHVCKSR